jgi:hypothetical protein
VLLGCEQHVERTANVDVHGLSRLGNGTGHGSDRGLVKNHLAAGGCFVNRCVVEKVALDEVNLGHVRQVLELTVGEVVQAHDVVAVHDQSAAQVRADEPGCPRDECPHRPKKVGDPEALGDAEHPVHELCHARQSQAG